MALSEIDVAESVSAPQGESVAPDEAQTRRIGWYRVPIDRALLKQLTARSDRRGLMQAGGHLALLVVTGGVAVMSAGVWPWWVTALLVWLHGTCWSFLLNGFHELVHGTVFKTSALNGLFLNVFSFLGQNNPVQFRASHMEHHKYTLHPPDDLEVVLPIDYSVKGFLQCALLNPWGFLWSVRYHARVARGALEGEWEHALFPEDQPEKRQELVRWARIVLFGHAAWLVVCLAMIAWTRAPHWVVVPFVTTFAPHIGGWLLFLLNNTQHAGLSDNVPDFRLCSRTIRVNPLFEWLYWHMNYHIEHHMYAGVPCYHLRRLHRAIAHELPYCPHGLVETWSAICDAQKRRREDPGYQFRPAVPESGHSRNGNKR